MFWSPVQSIILTIPISTTTSTKHTFKLIQLNYDFTYIHILINNIKNNSQSKQKKHTYTTYQ